MPVSTIAPRRAYHFDKNLELRNYQAAAISADAFELGVPFVAAAHDCFKLIVQSDIHTGFSAGAAQWTVSLEASTAMGGTYKAVDSVVLDGTKSATYEAAVSGMGIEQIVPNAKFVRVRATKLGGVGALTYGAFLSPDC